MHVVELTKYFVEMGASPLNFGAQNERRFAFELWESVCISVLIGGYLSIYK